MHFRSYKAVPLTKRYSRDWKSCYVIASDLTRPVSDIIRVEVSTVLGKA